MNKSNELLATVYNILTLWPYFRSHETRTQSRSCLTWNMHTI